MYRVCVRRGYLSAERSSSVADPAMLYLGVCSVIFSGAEIVLIQSLLWVFSRRLTGLESLFSPKPTLIRAS